MDPLTILNGSLSLVFVVISVLIGVIMLSTYFRYKEKLLLYVGITWIGLVSPWYPSSISFLVALFNEVGISIEYYFLIGNVAAPLIIIIWIYAFTQFFYKSRRRIILILTVIYSVVFESIFLFLLLTDPTTIGEFNPPIDVDFTGIYLVLAVSVILIVTITGIIFSYKSIKAQNPEIKLKGKFLLAAFISYTFGAFLDAAIPLSAPILIISRLILISAAIEWYFGFILPDWVKNKLLK